MAYDHRQVIEAQFDQLRSERARAVAEYEDARLREDPHGTMAAANQILETDNKLGQLNNIANQMIASQQQQAQVNRHGLSADEVEIAHSLAQNDPRFSDDQREQIYAQNRARYQHARRVGLYRDDQGRVTR